MDAIQEPAGTDKNALARPYTLREGLEILFRDRRRIGLAFAISFGLVLVAAMLAPSRYVSDASLLVRLGHEYVYVAEGSTSNSGAMPVAFSRDEALSGEAEILMSRDLIARAISRIGVAHLYPELGKVGNDPRDAKLDRAVERFRKSFKAELLKDSTVLRLGFEHKDPVVAQQALRALIDTYLDRRRAIFSDAHVQFLSEQVAGAGKRLQAAEARLAEFKRGHGIVNYEQQLSLLLQQGNDLEGRLNDFSQQFETAAARAKRLKQMAGSTPASVVAYSETLGDPQTPRQLLDLRLKEQGLSARYLDRNPLVQNARQDVTTAERFLAQQQRDPPRNVRTARNPVLEQVELDLMRTASDESALAGGRKALEERMQQLQRRTEALSEQQARLNELSLEQKLLEESYANYARKLEAARIDEARAHQDRTNVSVLQSASRPLASESMRLPLLAIGFFFSLGVALVVAFLSEALRASFQLPEQVERSLGLPVLATLPRVGG